MSFQDDYEGLTVDILREIFRNLIPWRGVFASDGVDTLTCDGLTVSLWDMEYLYLVSQQILPIRQRQAIRLCLVQNMSEQDATVIMHIDDTNPVAMYATSGLEKIIHHLRCGILPPREHVFSHERKASLPVYAPISGPIVEDDDMYMDVG